MVQSRRQVLLGLPAAAAAGAALAGQAHASQPAPAVRRSPEQRYATVVDLADFAKPNADKPQGEAMQAAIDAASDAGVPLVMPKGGFVTDRSLRVWNTSGLDRAMPRISGRGIGMTVIEATGFAGAILDIRGVGQGPLRRAHFLHGGGLENLELRGLQRYVNGPPGTPVQHGLATLGWWTGRIANVRISRLTGDGIRVVGDTGVNSNPDFTASRLDLAGVRLERLAGWGYNDENPIGAPGWSWDRCVMTLCGRGGARVRSSGHEFRASSFSASGWVSETTPSAGAGIGVYLDGARGWSLNRTRFVGCEFDTSKDAQLALDYAHATTVEQTRFIHNDRYGQGALTPAVGVDIARKGAASSVQHALFRQILFRIDTPGTMTGFRWSGTANVRDIVIDGVLWSDETRGKAAITRYAGHDRNGANTAANYRIHDGVSLVSAGRPAPFLKARTAAASPTPSPARALGLGPWQVDADCARLQPGLWAVARDVRLPASGWCEIDLAAVVASPGGAQPVELVLRLARRTVTHDLGSLAAAPRRVRLGDRILANAGEVLGIELRAAAPLVFPPGARADLLLKLTV
ncbi:MAG: hypothetical protein KDJ41_08060 [Hyphomicrobiaceae bacterium]|nr:hypothetical protein [Hyphomicrobiaceae bacterium]